MPIVVEVVSPQKYSTWVAEQRKKSAAAADRSEQEMESRRLKAPWREGLRGELRRRPPGGGQGVKGAFPALDGSPLIKSRRPSHRIVLNGRPKTGDGRFRQQLPTRDIAAVIT